MLYVDERTCAIQLTRGDTARLSVPIVTDTGESYEVQTGDTFRFTIKKTTKEDSPVLIQKTGHGSNTFWIEPSDTKDLPFGKYVYDVELTTDNGDVYTVIEPSLFELLKEVTY